MTIKFLQNGIKTNDGRYIPVFYSIGNDLKTIYVYARQYGHRLPADIGDIQNDTDTQADYFETDHVRIGPGNPYWFAAYAAASKKRMSELKKQLAETEKKRAVDPVYYEIMTESIRGEMARLAK